MSLLEWDPLEDFGSLRREMSRWMEGNMGPLGITRRDRNTDEPMRLPLDAYATDEEIVITAAVPGLEPEDVEVTLVGDTLTIEGTFRRPLENVDYIFLERPYGPFRRSVKVNIPIVTEMIEAKFERGLLMVILPKASRARPRIIEVKTEET